MTLYTSEPYQKCHRILWCDLSNFIEVEFEKKNYNTTDFEIQMPFYSLLLMNDLKKQIKIIAAFSFRGLTSMLLEPISKVICCHDCVYIGGTAPNEHFNSNITKKMTILDKVINHLEVNLSRW